MKSDANHIYLGKSGKVYGPFTSKEMDLLFSSGKLNEYSWIWDYKLQNWKALDTPPPSLHTSGDQTSRDSSPNSQGVNWNTVEALCYDHQAVISGRLETMTQSGCILVVPFNSHGSQLSSNAFAKLNLFDRTSKKNVETRVRIVNVELNNNSLVYRLRWNEVPTFQN